MKRLYSVYEATFRLGETGMRKICKKGQHV